MHPYLRLHVRLHPAVGSGPTAPSPPAALVRRVLGKAFIDSFCPFGEPHCQGSETKGEARAKPQDQCQLAEQCPYGVLFAGSRSSRPPFALHLPENGSHAGAVLELTLLGPAWPFYPWVLSALQRAFELGLGKERRPWRIAEVLRIGPDREPVALCDGDLTQLPATLAPDALGLGLEPFLAPQPVEIRLLSPARLLHAGRLLPGRAPVPFGLLIARILDRFQGLFGETASEILHPAIRATVEAEAAKVPLLAEDTRWEEVRDYSARSGAEMLLGGKVGRLLYGSEAARFFPILRAGEILHVGKNPTAGCGRIEVTLPGPP